MGQGEGLYFHWLFNTAEVLWCLGGPGLCLPSWASTQLPSLGKSGEDGKYSPPPPTSQVTLKLQLGIADGHFLIPSLTCFGTFRKTLDLFEPIFPVVK